MPHDECLNLDGLHRLNLRTWLQTLQTSSTSTPHIERQDALDLLHHISQQPRSWWLSREQEPLQQLLKPEQLQALSDGAKRLTAGEPLAYVLGEQAFMRLMLRVTPDTLIPRPDTEVLVNWGAEILRERQQHALQTRGTPDSTRVLDLGTGSGAVILGLWDVLQGQLAFEAVATDQCAAALQVAQHNAATLGAPVEFLQGDWFEALTTPVKAAASSNPTLAQPQAPALFDLILSNPPYIEAQDPHLTNLQHEPISALVSGADGLDDIRRMVQAAPKHLKTGGWLVLEHGWNQAEAVRDLLKAAGFANVGSRQDLGGRWRCSAGQWLLHER